MRIRVGWSILYIYFVKRMFVLRVTVFFLDFIDKKHQQLSNSLLKNTHILHAEKDLERLIAIVAYRYRPLTKNPDLPGMDLSEDL